jgi:hypothetical protein
MARQPREPGLQFHAIRRLESDCAFPGGVKRRGGWRPDCPLFRPASRATRAVAAGFDNEAHLAAEWNIFRAETTAIISRTGSAPFGYANSDRRQSMPITN